MRDQDGRFGQMQSFLRANPDALNNQLNQVLDKFLTN